MSGLKNHKRSGSSKKSHRGIFYRFFLLSSLLSIIIITVFAIFTIPRQQETILKSIEKQAKIVSASINQVCGNALISEEYGFIVDHNLRMIRDSDDIVYIIVVGKDGFSLVHTGGHWERRLRAEPSWVMAEGQEGRGYVRYSSLVGMDVFHYIYPIKFSLIQWGWLNVGLSVKQMKNELNTLYMRILWLVLTCFLIGVFGSYGFARLFTSPILKLQEVTRKIAQGDLSARVDIPSMNEISNLAQSFNQMAENLQKTTVNKDYVDNIIQHMNDMLIVTTPDGIITTINNATLDYLNYTKEEILHQSIEKIIPKDSLSVHKDWLKHLIRHHMIYHIETQYIAQNGNTIPILFSASVMKNKKDEIEGIICLGLNITRRKAAEKAMTLSEERYRSILETIDQGYYEMDLMGNLVYFNDSMCKLLGYTEEELTRMNYRDYTDEENAEKILSVLTRIDETGSSVKGAIWEFFRKDKARRKVGASITIMRDSADQPIGYRGVASDITDRLILEDQLIQAQKLESIGQLAAGISHEINTPIQYVGDNLFFLKESFSSISAVMATYEALCNALKNNDHNRAAVHELEILNHESDISFLKKEVPLALDQSIEGVDRVTTIVQAMKTFSHPGIEEPTQLNINAAILSAITVSRNVWKYIADVETELAHDLQPVYCYAGELNQVILNIIINAAHAVEAVIGDDHERKGKITVTSRKQGDWIEIRIQDTGNGIPEDIRSRIFDPFFTTKDVGQGTGQGLSIAHSVIVTKHAGTIRFETELGKGTTFIIGLPAEGVPVRKKEGLLC